MTAKFKFFRAVIAATIVLSLLSCNLPGRSRVSIIITSHADGQSVVLNEEFHLISLATSSNGVASVEFYVNGILIQTHTPMVEAPVEFTVEQAWTPEQEGMIVLSVKALDVNGNASEPTSISLNVVTSISEIEQTPTLTETPEDFPQTQTAMVGCTNDAEFVEHVTIPINSFLTAGSSFTKIWRVRNSGSCDWVAFELIHVSGDLLSASTPQALPIISTGENVDIAVGMVVPTSPGTYSAVWRIRSSDGTVFGPELALTIIVPLLPTNTPNPTPTFTLTPTKTPTNTPTLTPTPTETSAPLSVAQVVANVLIEADDWETATVACPAGSVIVSGGFAAHPELRVYNSTRNGNGWQVYAYNNSLSSRYLNAYATCLYNSGGSVSHVHAQTNAAANDTTYVTAECPTGSVATGGGWVVGTDEAIELYNSSKYYNGWIIYVRNTGIGTPLIHVYAICLSSVGGTTDIVYEDTDINPGDVGFITALCPTGTFVVGGGFAQHPDISTYNTSKDENGWINYAMNHGTVQKTMYTYAVCYSP